MKIPFITYIIAWIFALILLIAANWYFHIDPEKFIPDDLHTNTIPDTFKYVQDTSLIDSCSNRKMVLSGVSNFKSYKIEYAICDSVYDEAVVKRNSIKFVRKLGDLYKELLISGDKDIESIAGKFIKIKDTYSLSNRDLAFIIVNSVQRIPYTLVHRDSHKDCQKQLCMTVHDQLARKHPFQDWAFPGGCAEKVNPAAVFSPLEVAYHHMADCDSRTLFLYAVMKKIGYDVVILNSDIEVHSILGINIQGGMHAGNSGFNDRSSGKHYIVWETTTEVPPGVYQFWNERAWYIELR